MYQFRLLACTLTAFAGLSSHPSLAQTNPQTQQGKENETALYWPQWRGPLSTGAAPHANPPVEWSESENVRWKIHLPGKGHSTPIVWKNQLFVTTAVPDGPELPPKYSNAPGAHDNAPVTHRQKYVVLAISRSDGSVLWEKVVNALLPHEGGHFTASHASASPVTDGEVVIASFGSAGLHCLDLKGALNWTKDLGRMNTKHGHGEGSSPALHGNTVVVNWDHEGQSFVMALDKQTGEERWKVVRDEVTSWATPIIVEHAGKPQLIISGTERVRSYDLATGTVLWECGGLSANIVASPVAGNGMVFTGSSYEKRAMLAIRLKGSKGDITRTAQVAWSRSRSTPYVPSPLLYKDTLYFLRHYQGILSRVHATSGSDKQPPLRLPGIRDVYASPVAAAGRLYITDRSGITVVVQHEGTPAILARNQLEDSFSASAALVDGELFLRGQRYLYSIAAAKN
jgi:outer membrane protein assembly factor BamB